MYDETIGIVGERGFRKEEESFGVVKTAPLLAFLLIPPRLVAVCR